MEFCQDPFDSDDSIADPDFISSSNINNGSSSSSSSTSANNSNDDNDNNPHNVRFKQRRVSIFSQSKKIGKKRIRCPEMWRKNLAKTLRN